MKSYFTSLSLVNYNHLLLHKDLHVELLVAHLLLTCIFNYYNYISHIKKKLMASLLTMLVQNTMFQFC
jgi:hypothetical protein